MGNTQVTVSFMTTAPSLVAPMTRAPGGPRVIPRVILIWGVLLVAYLAPLLAVRRERRAPRWALAVLLILTIAGLTGACGGGGGSGGGGGVHDPGTTPGPYSITVTATSGAVSHAVTYTLTVTQ
jgi:hypothetical protein